MTRNRNTSPITVLTEEQSFQAFMRVWRYQESQHVHGLPLQGDLKGQLLKAFPVGARVAISVGPRWGWQDRGTVVEHRNVPTPKITYPGEDLRGFVVLADDGREHVFAVAHMNCLVWYVDNQIRPILGPSLADYEDIVSHPVLTLGE